jgi:hypothetical protein
MQRQAKLSAQGEEAAASCMASDAQPRLWVGVATHLWGSLEDSGMWQVMEHRADIEAAQSGCV